VPEGDTIAYAARRIRPVLEGAIPDEIVTPQPRHALDRWPERLAGRAVAAVETHGKHLLIRFEGDLVLHSHLGMSGSWTVAPERRAALGPLAIRARQDRAGPASSGWRRAWIVLRRGQRWVAELDGPTLELITAGRARFDRRLGGLGPDVIAAEFDSERFLARLRSDDQTRALGDALLDQSNVAGIGNIWKAEGCWEAAVDPWRAVSSVSDDEARKVIESMRPRMLRSANEGPRTIQPRIYNRAGRPCPRCGAVVQSRGQGDANRTTYWCPGCQR
jgi:endonuclease-8